MARSIDERFYKTREWKRCREAYAKSAGYLCENCMAKGIYTPGKFVHHVEELTPANVYNPEKTYGFDNLRLVCAKCHAEEHSEREKGKRFYFDDAGRVVIKK